jgi:hypothetical protein
MIFMHDWLLVFKGLQELYLVDELSEDSKGSFRETFRVKITRLNCLCKKKEFQRLVERQDAKKDKDKS